MPCPRVQEAREERDDWAAAAYVHPPPSYLTEAAELFLTELGATWLSVIGILLIRHASTCERDRSGRCDHGARYDATSSGAMQFAAARAALTSSGGKKDQFLAQQSLVLSLLDTLSAALKPLQKLEQLVIKRDMIFQRPEP